MMNFNKPAWAALLLAACASLASQVASAEQIQDAENQEQPADMPVPVEASPASGDNTTLPENTTQPENATSPENATQPESATSHKKATSPENTTSLENATQPENEGGTIVTEPQASSSELTRPDVQVEQADQRGEVPRGKMSLRQRVAVNRAAISDENRHKGKDFLTAYAGKQGVISLSDGLQYLIIKAGNGKNPGDNSTVQCRYRGMLTDGSAFDETDQNQPARIHVSGLVPGLKEAVKLMSAGAKWQVVIPPQLAYGERGDRAVAPNAVLIYDIEIVAVD